MNWEVFITCAVTGAGDTVIAGLAVALGSGLGLLESAEFANRVAGLVVSQVGTTALSAATLSEAASELDR